MHKIRAVVNVELVSIKPIRTSKKGNQDEHTPVCEESDDFESLTLPIGEFVKRDMGTIGSNDFSGWKQCKCQERSDGHDDHESDVSTCFDCLFSARVPFIT